MRGELSAAPSGETWLLAIADPVKVLILRALIELEEATAADLHAHGSASYQTLRRHLVALRASGVLDERRGQSDGETPGRPPARFRFNPDIRRSVEIAFG